MYIVKVCVFIIALLNNFAYHTCILININFSLLDFSFTALAIEIILIEKKKNNAFSFFFKIHLYLQEKSRKIVIKIIFKIQKISYQLSYVIMIKKKY